MTLRKQTLPGSAGQSIIEILFATTIVAGVLVAIMVGMTLAVKNTAESKLKTLATAKAQETIETFRRERVALGWQQFYEVGQNLTAQANYCVPEIASNSAAFKDMSTVLAAGDCASSDTIDGTQLRRQIGVVTGADNVELTVIVKWQDGSREGQVELIQDFKESQL